jgi:nitroreductase
MINNVNKMKKQILTLALMLTMGAGAALAQDCCKKQGAEMGEKKECGMKSHEFLDVIMTRTSIRKFTDEKVKPCCVEKMLRAAMAAPTAVNKQPWHFVVVDDKEVLNKLAGEGRRGDMLRNAPLAIVVCGDMSKALEGKGQEYWIQDTSAATENLLLAAHAMGLGAVWTGQWPMENRYPETQKVLGLPETIIPLCTVIIGHPAENPTPKDKWKPENVSYNKFGLKE